MYGPLLNTLMLAFANKYQAPHVLPLSFGFTWWQNVFAQSDLLQAFFNSFLVATLSTFFSMLICLPAAYAIARYHFKGRSLFLFSFLLSNAFPKIGLYTAIGIIFYKMQLMGTLTGVVLINILNTMIFMIWIPTGAFQNVYRQQEEAARDVGGRTLADILYNYFSECAASNRGGGNVYLFRSTRRITGNFADWISASQDHGDRDVRYYS